MSDKPLEPQMVNIQASQVKPAEIQALRKMIGWQPDEVAVWEKCLRSSLYVSATRDITNDQLVGIGFLAGNARHAVVCDLVVHPGYQRQGIGARLLEDITQASKRLGIRYITLTYDIERSPWLAGFYAKHGFVSIQNAMQLQE